MLSISEEILLIALDDKRGIIKPLPAPALEYALAGAILMELALMNRIETDITCLRHKDDQSSQDPILLRVVSSEPTGDSLLDDVLKELKQDDKGPLPTTHWLKHLANKGEEIQERVLASLISKGVLKQENRRILWVFEVRRYPLINNREIKEVKSRLRDLLLSNDIPDPQDAVLISLVNACQLFNEIFNEDEMNQVKQRIIDFSKLDLIGQEVTKSIRKIEQAMSMALAMSVIP